MLRWALALLACATLSAQTPRDLFIMQCAGCHGTAGEGSRGPALNTSARQRANDVDSLVALLRRGVPGTEMPAFAVQTIPDQPVRDLAKYVLSLRGAAAKGSSDLSGRGAELFRGKGKCATCHRVDGEGSTSGPDLSDIGRQRDPPYLLRAVVDPEADVYDSFAGYRWTIPLPDNYLLVEVATKTGDRVIGSRLNEDAFSIQVRDEKGRIRSFLKSEVADINRQWGKSPMPSYRDVFFPRELDDLVAYLVSLRGPQ